MVSWLYILQNVSSYYRNSFQNAMDSKVKAIISNVDHGDRVTALEAGITGLEDSMDQQRNNFNSKLVKSLFNIF